MFLGKILIFYQQGNDRLLLFGLLTSSLLSKCRRRRHLLPVITLQLSFLKYALLEDSLQSHKHRSLFTERR